MSGDDNEIKSALDIAMEKAQKLGSLSPEESRKIKERELMATGEALAKRYFNRLPMRDIDVEMGRHDEEERKIIVRSILSNLANGLDIKHEADFEALLEAIRHFSGDSDTVQGIKELSHKYREAVEKAWQENMGAVESAKLEELKLNGISGSAILPAAETSPKWLEIRQALESSYGERLAELKKRWTKYTL